MLNEKVTLGIDVKRLAVDKVQVIMGDALIDYLSMDEYHTFIERLADNERFTLDITERDFMDFHAPAVMD